MTKTLLKKQMQELFSWLYINRKTGKKRNNKGIAIYALLYLYLFGMLGYMFYTMERTLCKPLSELGLGWLYFALVSLFAIVFGILGSVFHTFSSLYRAKDNDLLFSMPIPVSKILLMRLSGVYIMGLLYEWIVMIPALIVWVTFAEVSWLGIICSILISFVLAIFILSLSCIVGWMVAQISGKVRNKNFITVVLSLTFMGIYWWGSVRAYEMLTKIVVNAKSVANNMKIFLYPFYQMGLAAEGKLDSMLIFTTMIVVFFLLVYFVLSKGLMKLATINKGMVKAKYKERYVKAGSADCALLKKEWRRFIGSSNYMLNCGLGIIVMLIASGVLLVKRQMLSELVPELYKGAQQILPLLMTGALCMITSMNDITAPSVSLEGKNLWLVQVLPVSSWQVLKAKLKLHLILIFPPAAVLTGCVLFVFRPDAKYLFLIPFTVAAFIVTMALFGLFMNLKAPNLNWTNEIVPIKQSLSVTVALFGGWAIVLTLGALYLLVNQFVNPFVYLVFVCIILIFAAIQLFLWLKKKGSQIFAML